MKLTLPTNRFRASLLGLTAIFIFTWPWLNFGGWNNPLMLQFFYFLGICALLLLIIFLGTGMGRLSRPVSGLFWLVGLLFLSKTLSTIFSVLPMRGVWGAYMFMADGLVFLGCLLVFGLFLLCLKPSDREISIGLNLLFVQAVLLSFQVLLEALRLGAPALAVRAKSPLTNSDYFLSYLCLLIPIGIGLAVAAWRRGGTWGPSYYLSGLFFCLLAAYFSIPSDLQFLNRQKGPDNQAQTSFLQSNSNSERFTQWHLGWQIGKEHPWLGTGPGATRAYFFGKAKDLTDWDYNIAMDLPHNDLIQQFSQGGVLGLLSYIVLWLAYFWTLIRYRVQVEASRRPLFWSLVGGLGLFLLFNQFIFTAPVTAVLVVFLTALGLLLTKSLKFVDVSWRQPRWFLSLLLVVIVATPTLIWGMRYEQATVFENAARLAENDADVRKAATQMEKAVSLFPREENFQSLLAGYHTVSVTQGLEDPVLLKQAEAEQEKAIALNPYLPKQKLNLGIIRYLGATDTESRQAAIREIKEAVAILPWNTYFYTNAVQGILLKPDRVAGDYLFEQLQEVVPEGLKGYFVDLRKQYDTVMSTWKG